jgi:hypothetical protein
MIDWVLSRTGLVSHDGAWIAQSMLAEYHAAGLCHDLEHVRRKIYRQRLEDARREALRGGMGA